MNKAIRDSEQRKQIHHFLSSRKDHPTAKEVYLYLNSIMPTVSLGNVYRNLKILISQGLVRKLELSNSSRYDSNTGRHAHLRCQICGRVEDLAFGLDEILKLSSKNEHGYAISGFSMEFTGICPDCKNKTFPKYDDSYGLELLGTLKNNAKPSTCTQIARLSARHPQSVNGKLKNLCERGLVETVSKGIYKITKKGLECLKEEK